MFRTNEKESDPFFSGRIPRELHRILKSKAALCGRTLKSEVLTRLAHSVINFNKIASQTDGVVIEQKEEEKSSS